MPPPPVAPPAAETPFLTFPPFPQVPEGALVAFKDFKPSGIQMSVSGEEDAELDGLGIPTIELRVKHNTDESKTGKKRKKKSKAKAADGEPTKRLTWWEEWEEGEDLRVVHAGFSLDVPRVDRLIKASQDFAEGRRWPAMLSGVRTFWDQYRLYLGLLTSTPVFRKPTRKRDQDEAEGDISDDDVPSQEKSSGVPKDVSGDDDDFDGDGDAAEGTGANIEELTEERLIAFLNDPQLSTKIFLTHYMREHGLVWSDKNLHIGPRLVEFFINFLLRNRVLPEPSHERGLRATLEITALATKELPLTAKLGQALPDVLSTGLRDVLGRKTTESFQPNNEVVAAGWGTCDTKDDSEADEREKKRPKIEVVKNEEVADEFEAELKAANVKVIHTDGLAPDAVKQIVEDNIGMDVDVNPGDTIINLEWGSGDNTWGGDDGAWGEAADMNADGTAVVDNSAGWGKQGPDDSTWGDAWAPPKQSLLMSLLGPTTLPLTHTTGIVEQSTRRIKSIILPPPTAPAPVPRTDEGENPEAVEEDLEKRFAKVVMEPWVGEEGSDVRIPIIRNSSKGDVYPGTKRENGTIVEGETPPLETKVHNPLKSDITLLVEVSQVDILSVGMGLLATWVQLVRQERMSGGSLGAKSKKKKKSKGVPKGYWYMEELLIAFPSFYTQEKLVE